MTHIYEKRELESRLDIVQPASDDIVQAMVARAESSRSTSSKALASCVNASRAAAIASRCAAKASKAAAIARLNNAYRINPRSKAPSENTNKLPQKDQFPDFIEENGILPYKITKDNLNGADLGESGIFCEISKDFESVADFFGELAFLDENSSQPGDTE